MKAIILSAGRGSRMGKLTDNSPKSLTKLFDKPLLEYQINALKSAGISEIGIITGYKSEALEPFIASHNLIAFHNESFADSNMVYSMLCAREWLENSDFVVSYSDIFYDASGVRDLANLQCDAGILYATNWLAIWQERFPNNVLDDAESFRLDSENNLLEIGSKAKSIDEIQGQFMGLMKFSKEGFKSLCQMLQTLDIKALDSTAMLQKFIESKQCVKCVAFSGVWGEVDSQSDIKIYEKMYSIKANSSLGNHCIDLAFRHKARTQSPLTLCQNAKNSTSKTADTRILGEMQGDSMESNRHCEHSQNVKQSKKSCEAQPNLAPLRGAEKEKQGGSSASALLELEAENSEALPLKACRRLASEAKQKQRSFFSFGSRLTSAVGKADRGSGEEGAALFAKKSDYINETNLTESRRIEMAENAESHTESLKDSSNSVESNAKSQKDSTTNPPPI